MKYAIRYYTRGGNTEKLAKAIAEQTGLEAKTVENNLEEKVEVLLLGCSYYAFDMDPAVKAFVNDNKDKIGKIVLFGTSAMIKSMKKPLGKLVDGLGIEIAEEEFHCPGSFGVMHKGRPNADDVKAAKDFAASIVK